MDVAAVSASVVATRAATAACAPFGFVLIESHARCFASDHDRYSDGLRTGVVVPTSGTGPVTVRPRLAAR